MRSTCALPTLSILLFAGALSGQTEPLPVSEPFKLGTFDIGGNPEVGIVLRDAMIVELDAANRELERDDRYPSVPMPADMLELIERYDYGLKRRLYEIVDHLIEHEALGGSAPGFVHALDDVRTLPPILYPGKILNAAVNFYSHVNEAGSPEERAEARRQRRENRGVPYLFLKPGRGAVVGQGDTIVIPYGRDRIDWEVELGAVIGRTGKYISANEAEDHVFGYMVSLDISDRGGRPPGGNPLTSDWFVGKGHDTFAPQGPWIVPKEFYGNPMEILRQSLDVGEERVQEATAGDMIHTLWELIEYGSSIITLYPGDVINNGTSGGTAAGVANQRNQEVQYLQAGQVITATIEGIGTLRLPVRDEEAPEGLTGAQLPPVASYRDPPGGR
ncbi:MAG: fumarylacetoacetate hydrolase family protein [Gemmatimonadetes bacterium]|nr:fumarylacetoacetate hydrolase family protein [Gemmatimonadota bacterium]